MDENEKNVPEEKKMLPPDKKLKLDLSQALTPDDDDDIIELKDEIALPQMEEEYEIDLIHPSTEESSDDESNENMALNLKAFDMQAEEPEADIPQADELIFEEEEEDDIIEDEEIQPLVVENPLETGNSDEVIEITEFDDILSEDVNEMVTLADDGEALDSEEEFLELIDVEEEDSLPGEVTDENVEIEDEIIQFEGLKEEVDDAELENFIKNSLDDEIRIDDDLEDELTDSLGIEAGSEMRMSDETPQEEDLDFNIDSNEISKKIDQVDTIFFDETEQHVDLADEPPSDDGLFEDIVADTVNPDPEIENTNGPPTNDDTPAELPPPMGIANLAPEQIEESIERVIKQNFSDKIESIVAEVIEKAVSKEIDRLKNILLDDNSNESA